MAFKASNVIPAIAYEKVKVAAVNLKSNCQRMITTLAAGNVDYRFIGSVYVTLSNANNQFNTLKATAGLEQFAKDQEDDQTYDVAAEFTAMQSAIASAMTWIQTNAPTNVTVKNVTLWPDANGSYIADEFTPTQTATLRTVLQTVVDSIE